MKSLTKYILTIIAIFCLLGCGDDKKEILDPNLPPTLVEPDNKPLTFIKRVSLSPHKCNKTCYLTELYPSKIIDIQVNASWLRASNQNIYNSELVLRADENIEKYERGCKVVVCAESGNKIIFDVVQRAYGMDDNHNESTDQPAYIRRK